MISTYERSSVPSLVIFAKSEHYKHLDSKTIMLIAILFSYRYLNYQHHLIKIELKYLETQKFHFLMVRID